MNSHMFNEFITVYTAQNAPPQIRKYPDTGAQTIGVKVNCNPTDLDCNVPVAFILAAVVSGECVGLY